MDSGNEPSYQPPPRSWAKKFADAAQGCRAGMRGQNSFVVHLVMAAAVIVAAFLLRLSVAEWGLVLVCITLVLMAELFNSSLEKLARAIDRNENPQLASALDIASGAVLVAAVGAAIVGLVVFVPPALRLLTGG